ncbi:hypothetical protein Taro_024641 [Colocasia esculenta]|uniref:Uncharacterized protein n=1 Tax=Colocasia esculenta TaxID=4460 RepID=A0A843V810_COLES|nr:hypothetical protein [Colocasia esculenta]
MTTHKLKLDGSQTRARSKTKEIRSSSNDLIHRLNRTQKSAQNFMHRSHRRNRSVSTRRQTVSTPLDTASELASGRDSECRHTGRLCRHHWLLASACSLDAVAVSTHSAVVSTRLTTFLLHCFLDTMHVSTHTELVSTPL